jgi:hypothetical protein
MGAVAGIDFSTRRIDIVLLDEDSDRATPHPYDLPRDGAFLAALAVKDVLPQRSWWEEQQVVSIWLELPWARFLKSVAPLMRMQGALLAVLPRELVAGELAPDTWKALTVGKRQASKPEVAEWVLGRWVDQPGAVTQDACDAYAIAWAGRGLERTARRPLTADSGDLALIDRAGLGD